MWNKEFTHGKILIIDDSIVHAHYLKSILEDSYEISLAHTANDGLQYAKTGEVFPDPSGCRHAGDGRLCTIKKLQEELVTEHIPVILITSLSDANSEEQDSSSALWITLSNPSIRRSSGAGEYPYQIIPIPLPNRATGYGGWNDQSS